MLKLRLFITNIEKLNFKEIIKSKIKKNQFLFKYIKKLSEYSNLLNLKYFSGSNKDIFTNIYLNNKWRGKYSFSGAGSNLNQTKTIREEIPKIIKKYKIKNILDIPCGDFYWMRELDLKDLNYIGADLVSDIINQNIKEFTKNNINFKVLDLTSDRLPCSDLIFCRDCLVHLSFEDIFKALRNIKKSNSKYLMTTNFLKRENNYDIPTGSWRTINLCESPFNLCSPIENITENCSEGKEGSFLDKALSIWEVKSIPNFN